MTKLLADGNSTKGRTLLGIFQNAKDPETGEQLSFEELVSNSDTFLYESRGLN